MFRIAVLNPNGNDSDQSFPDFAGEVNDRIHAPVNYHGYAACTAGSFHQKNTTVARAQSAILLLIRRDPGIALKTLKKLKQQGKIVAVSLKESGSFQVAELFQSPRKFGIFKTICSLADGCLSSTPDLVPFYKAAGGKEVEFIPTPYPVEDSRWDFSRPVAERQGIFIGTREFKTPSRNHLAAVLSARLLGEALGERITVINSEGRSGRKLLAELKFKPDQLQVIEGRIAYSQYLRLMAQHKLIFQLDKSGVPGQVAADALLCRIPCLGGDGAIERIIFPELNSHTRNHEQLWETGTRLLKDQNYYQQTMEQTLHRAHEQISFGVIAKKLEVFFERISGHSLRL